MKLYNVPRNSKIKVITDIQVPPSSPIVEKQDLLNFSHIDGMYSYCTKDSGEVVHLVAWAEVEIVDDKSSKD